LGDPPPDMGHRAGLGHELRPISFDEQTLRFALVLSAVN
jgi:hypothetical protein